LLVEAGALWAQVLGEPGTPGSPEAPGEAEQDPWEHWPFGPMEGGELLPELARVGFILLIFLGIVFYLRFLFGPGGKFRDAWIDEEQDESEGGEKSRKSRDKRS
jgi:hypothetical protein